MLSLSQFTQEQWTVLDALIQARAEAARELGDCTNRLQDAIQAGDQEVFNSAKAEFAAVKSKCDALKLAIDVATEIFLKGRENGSTAGLRS